MTFAVGTRVKVIAPANGRTTSDIAIGQEGVVIALSSGTTQKVRFDNHSGFMGSSNVWGVFVHCLAEADDTLFSEQA